MKCSRCEKENSPPNARFCVDCGYALRQACPYGCGFTRLPVQAGNPPSQCPQCERFAAYCPNCLRAAPLGARACPTPRCARARVSPREPLSAHGVRAGGAPVELNAPWLLSRPAMLQPGAHAPFADQRCGGLATRYGKIVWWKDAKLHFWPAPAPDAFWPVGAPQTVEAIEPLFRGGIFPHREALLLAHGHAYLLGQNSAARVAMGQTNATKQDLSLREVAPETDEFAWMNQTNSAPETAWQAHQVEWLAQNESADFWFALGVWQETLVGARARGSSALFEGERWILPASVGLNEWQELLVWQDAPLLRCQRAIWRESNGVWEKIFELPQNSSNASASLDGALADESFLWVWGQRAGQLWVERLSAGAMGDNARAWLPFAAGDRLSVSPVVWNTRITFFVAGSRHGAITLDVAKPLDDAQIQVLPAATEVLWAAAARHEASDAQWLLYALDDGELVKMQMLQQLPADAATAPLELMRFRAFRDPFGQSKGATLAATLSGDCLVICYIGSRGAEAGVWLMACAWK